MVRSLLFLCLLIVNIYANKSLDQKVTVFSKYDGNSILIKWTTPDLQRDFTYKLYRTNNSNRILLSTLKKKSYEEVKNKFDQESLLAIFPYRNVNTLDEKIATKIFLKNIQSMLTSIIGSRTDISKALGTYYEDKTVRLKQKYTYEVEVFEKDKKIASKSFNIYTYKKAISPTPLAFKVEEDDDGINFSWQVDSLFNSYNMYIRKSPSTQFIRHNKYPILVNVKSDILYKDKTLKKNEMAEYKVTTVDVFGEESAFSSSATGYYKDFLMTNKIKYINTSINNFRVKLLWNKSKSKNIFYNIYRSNILNGKYKKVNVKPIPKNFYVDKTITSGKNYYYYITAVSPLGESKPSMKKLVSSFDVIAPPKVKNVKVNLNPGKVNLSWDNVKDKNLIGYNVYFAMNKDDKYYAKVNDKIIKNNKYIHTLPKNLSRFNYYYKVTAVDQKFNESEYSKILKVKLPDVIAPNQPIFSMQKVYKNKIYLQWTPIYDYDLSHYNIYTQEGTKLVKLNSKKIEKTQFELNNYKLDSLKKFMVSAVDKSGNESLKDKHILLNKRDTQAPLLSSIKYSQSSSGIKILLDIKDNDYNGFEVYRSSGKSIEFFKISNFIKTKSFTDKTLSKDTKYWYQLWVYDKTGNIKKSDTKEILWKK